MKKRITAMILALALCLGLTIPAFAADAPHDVDIVSSTATWEEFGDRLLDDCRLTANGVIGQEPFQREGFYDSVIFDVVAGGGYTLDMSFPAGRWRYYAIYMDQVLLNGEPLEGVAPYLSTIPSNYADTADPQKQYTFTCPDSMVSKPGAEVLFHVWLDWGDGEPDSDYTTYDGNVQFWLRVNPAQSTATTQPTTPTQSTTPTQPSTSSFADVPAGEYYAKPVSWAVAQGITNGTSDTTFSPYETCTTAQILTFLWRAAGRPGATSANMTWAQELTVIEKWATELGIVMPKATDIPCKRSVAVQYMWIAAGKPTPSVDYSFSDVPPTADYGPAASWAREKGITNGDGDGTFSPWDICNRAQIVTFLYRQFVEPITPIAPTQPSRVYSTDPGITLTLPEQQMNARTSTSYSMTVTGVNYTTDWYRTHGDPKITWTVDYPSRVSVEEILWDGVPRQLKIIGEQAGEAKITCKLVGSKDGYVAEAYCYITVLSKNGSTATTVPSTPSTPTTPSTSMTAEEMCAQVVELVNQERVKAGLSPLSTLPSLTNAANIRAQEITVDYRSDHTRPDGRVCFTVFNETGVTGWRGAGENIAAGQRSPEEVMNSWMNSTGHRENILDSQYTHIGVGYCNNHWVQMFIIR